MIHSPYTSCVPILPQNPQIFLILPPRLRLPHFSHRLTISNHTPLTLPPTGEKTLFFCAALPRAHKSPSSGTPTKARPAWPCSPAPCRRRAQVSDGTAPKADRGSRLNTTLFFVMQDGAVPVACHLTFAPARRQSAQTTSAWRRDTVSPLRVGRGSLPCRLFPRRRPGRTAPRLGFQERQHAISRDRIAHTPFSFEPPLCEPLSEPCPPWPPCIKKCMPRHMPRRRISGR